MTILEQSSGIHHMSTADLNAVLNRAALTLLGISGDEFIKRWNDRDFGSDPDSIPGVMEVAALLPFE
jgi:hypothetical protein